MKHLTLLTPAFAWDVDSRQAYTLKERRNTGVNKMRTCRSRRNAQQRHHCKQAPSIAACTEDSVSLNKPHCQIDSNSNARRTAKLDAQIASGSNARLTAKLQSQIASRSNARLAAKLLPDFVEYVRPRAALSTKAEVLTGTEGYREEGAGSSHA